MWIKVCGLRSFEAVAAALAMQVDALGFVFADSVRRVSPQQAAALARPARSRACCVAVTRYPTQALIDEVLEVFRPDVLQADVAELEQLRLPVTLELLPVVRAATAAPAPLPGRILLRRPLRQTSRVGSCYPNRHPCSAERRVLPDHGPAEDLRAGVTAP